jgi:integrase
MPRKLERPRYFTTRDAYYVQWHGKQVKLASGPKDEPDGPTYLKALDAFKTLMERGSMDTAGDANRVKPIFNAYMQAKEGKLRPKAFHIKREMLGLFVARYGDLKAGEVKPYHAESILTEMRKPRHVGKRVFRWNDAQCVIFLRQLKAAFAWAVKNELITRNPMAAIEMPRVRSKSRERIVTPAEHDKVLALLSKRRQQSLRRIIVALEDTGARPSELTEAKVSDFNPAIGAIEYFPDNLRGEHEHAHKTSGKGKHRVIYFTGQSLEMVKELCNGKKPTDYIFTTNGGRKYRLKTLDICFRSIRERIGLPHLVPYAYRHTFATRWLKQGKSIEYLATVLGNSPETIYRHYAHLINEHDTLRQQLEEFRQQGALEK